MSDRIAKGCGAVIAYMAFITAIVVMLCICVICIYTTIKFVETQ